MSDQTILSQRESILTTVHEPSYNMTSFKESPRKRGKEKPLPRLGAFDLFTLFTADIIREKVIFTR
ncbi:MAG TPA: hypothetical protein VGH64_04525 [Puia sp.]|jgi:hypothetical protein